jgi:hypothetical protein
MEGPLQPVGRPAAPELTKKNSKGDSLLKLPDNILSKIQELMDEHADETGKHIESRLGHHYGRQKSCGYDKKVVMNKVGAWRAAANSKQKTKAKKLLID